MNDSATTDDPRDVIVAMERAALDRWGRGDPVYRRSGTRWEIIQSHWSFTRGRRA